MANKKPCTTPCKECPFRKTSAPGWLGPNTGSPEKFVDSTEYNILHCHMKVDNEKFKGKALERAIIENPCVGAIQFLNNSLKLPRGAREPGPYQEIMAGPASKKNPDVFQWRHEFVQHHSMIKK